MKFKNNPVCWTGALFVALVALLTFLPVIRGEFLNWDDTGLFVENPWFRGLSPAHWQWMCTTVLYGHWQPLSWLSYALDYTVWGMNPHGWHVTNLLLHVVNSVLVYLLCLTFIRPVMPNENRQTGASAAAALAALFWAVHPLRVEVVAWLSTRGYLLCTAFCLLTVLFYLRAADQKRYPFAALLCFTLASLTKGIGMMLPLVLLLIDWFPLRRIGSGRESLQNHGHQNYFSTSGKWRFSARKKNNFVTNDFVKIVVFEKILFCALSLMTGIAAFLAKKTEGGMVTVEAYGPVQRIGQAIYGVWFYLAKTVWPQNLSPLYEKPPELWQVLSALLLTTAAAVLLFLFREKLRPLLLAVGAFLLLIFPMLGITQSGSQMFADRFTYLPTVPLFVLLAAGLVRLQTMQRVLFSALVFWLLMLGSHTAIYAVVWQNGVRLWRYATAVDNGRQPGSQNNLGMELLAVKEYEQARACFDRALFLRPDYPDALNNRALIFLRNSEYGLAVQSLNVALAQDSVSNNNRAKMHLVRGLALEGLNVLSAAENDFTTAVELAGAHTMVRLKALQVRARLRVLAGRKTKAKEDLNLILKLPDPSGEYHRRAKKALRLFE